MKPENRAKLVDAVGELREVRTSIVAIARRQEALDKAAREHFLATRGDLDALFHRELDIFETLTSVLEDETFDDAEARGLHERARRRRHER